MKKIMILFGACGLLSVGAENAYAKATNKCSAAVKNLELKWFESGFELKFKPRPGPIGAIPDGVVDWGDRDGHQTDSEARRLKLRPDGKLIRVYSFGPSTRPVRADSTVGQP